MSRLAAAGPPTPFAIAAFAIASAVASSSSVVDASWASSKSSSWRVEKRETMPQPWAALSGTRSVLPVERSTHFVPAMTWTTGPSTPSGSTSSSSTVRVHPPKSSVVSVGSSPDTLPSPSRSAPTVQPESRPMNIAFPVRSTVAGGSVGSSSTSVGRSIGSSPVPSPYIEVGIESPA